MGSLSQYTAIYLENTDRINSGSSRLMNEARPRALSALEDARLPEKGDEGFEKTSLEKMFAPDFGLNINRVAIPTDIAASFRCDVPALSSLLGVVVNDSFFPTSALLRNLPEGVTVMSLAKGAEEFPETFAESYTRIAPLDVPATALNTLLAQDGVFIHVDRGIKVANPIQIVNIFNSPMPLMGVRRVLIVAEEDSEVNILFCDHTQTPGMKFLSSEVIEVDVKKGATVDICGIEESSADTSRCSRIAVRQADGSTFRCNSTTLYNGVTRNDFVVNIEGSNAETFLSGMIVADGEMHVDNCSDVNHLAPRSKSNQLFKYLLDDNASGAFEGGIYVSPEAPFTEGFQTNRNIIASAGATMHTKPQLLIYNDEVKCSHGAATGQLDPQALFYMQTRGIPKDTARNLLMLAFMTDAIETLRLPALKSRLAMLVEKRLSGNDSQCGTCGNTSCHTLSNKNENH